MTIHPSHKIGGTYGNACEHCGCGSQSLNAEVECVPSAEGAAFAGRDRYAYKVTLIWNGSEVLEAHGTSVAVFEVMRAHLAGNFAGSKFNAWLGTYVQYSILMSCLNNGGKHVREWKDETGHAIVTVEPR